MLRIRRGGALFPAVNTRAVNDINIFNLKFVCANHCIHSNDALETGS